MIIAVVGENGAGKTTIAMNMAMVIKNTLLVEIGSKGSVIKFLTNGKLAVGWSDLELKEYKSDLKEFWQNGDIPFVPGPSPKDGIKKLLNLFNTSKKFDNIIFDVASGEEEQIKEIEGITIIKIHNSISLKEEDTDGYPVNIVISNKSIKGIDNYYLEKKYGKSIWEVPFSVKIFNAARLKEWHYSKHIIKEVEIMCLTEGLCENPNSFFKKIRAFVPKKGRKS